MKHEWRAVLQYKLTDEEARQLVEGYGHPEIDSAPDNYLASGEKPPTGDPRVWFGPHNILREEMVVVCWNCELAWDPELARKECTGESIFAVGPALKEGQGIGNIDPGVLIGVGRNDPCPCGSGVKFKRCHGAN